jgi:hypothetical protein
MLARVSAAHREIAAIGSDPRIPHPERPFVAKEGSMVKQPVESDSAKVKFKVAGVPGSKWFVLGNDPGQVEAMVFTSTSPCGITEVTTMTIAEATEEGWARDREPDGESGDRFCIYVNGQWVCLH